VERGTTASGEELFEKRLTFNTFNIRPRKETTEVSMRNRLMVFMCVLCCALMMSSVAFAAKAYYQGSTSVQWDNNTRMRACDGDVDGKASYAEFKLFGLSDLHYIYDYSGANDGLCGNTGSFARGINWHATCDSNPNWPDYCGDRSTH